LRIDGRMVDVALGGPDSRRQLVSGERRVDATLESDRTSARAARRGSAAATDAVRSPMPGRVVKVLVAPGDRVTASQAVVVVEAMKMENELRALAEATVRSVEVKAGQAVEANAVLVTFERADLARSA
jgi:biotin carboxyl carrier protein